MKQIIQTDQAPAAVGPYSQAVRTDTLLFVSGQIPLDPTTGELVQGDIQVQARQALRNLQAVIEAAGMSLQDTVKCTCFLNDMNYFSQFNNVYAEFFGRDPPARECVEVSRLPKDVLVEVSAICSF